MNIVFFGTSEFAVPSLEKLSKFHKIEAVVTKSDKPKGRRLKAVPSLIKTKAHFLKIPVISMEDMKHSEAMALLRSYRADLFVVVAYGKILSPDILLLPRLYPIGLHASLLPKFRGASPINWAILKGERSTGVTVFKLTKKMDAGDIIMQKETEILPSNNAESLSAELSNFGANLLVKAMEAIEEGTARFIKQKEGEATFTPKLKKEDGKIVWTMPADEIHNKIRAFYGWPGAFSHLHGRRIKIWETEIAGVPEHKGLAAGQIVGIVKDGIVVLCGEGALKIMELQAEGGKRMKASAYVHGNKIGIDDHFVN